jgi:hypothetical protein
MSEHQQSKDLPREAQASGSDPASDPVEVAIEEMARAAEALARAAETLLAPSSTREPSSSSQRSREANEEAQLFYRRLEQTGQLVDVNPTTDLASLPPHVTHVRYPDGRIERIGFSGSSYAA